MSDVLVFLGATFVTVVAGLAIGDWFVGKLELPRPWRRRG